MLRKLLALVKDACPHPMWISKQVEQYFWSTEMDQNAVMDPLPKYILESYHHQEKTIYTQTIQE